MDSTELQALVGRLEKLDGPSFEVDGEIWCSANGYEFVMWDGAGCVYRNSKAEPWDRGIKHAHHSEVRPYTASIDAAVALAVKHLDNGSVDIEVAHRSVGGKAFGRAEICGPHCYGEATAASPAIALCLALLRALQQGK